jgi:hypothetical protein
MHSCNFCDRLMAADAREIPSHTRHFRDTGRSPDSPPQRTIDDLEIIGWDSFTHYGEPTPLFAPIVRHQGTDLHASSRAYCNAYRRCISRARSISHDTQHVALHRRRTGTIEATDEVTTSIYSFVLSRGEPLSCLEFLRRTPIQEAIPSGMSFTDLSRARRGRLEDALRQRCASVSHANLAIDGWSDPRGRRYQGIMVRLPEGGSSSTVLLLALKEIKSLHDSA